jgi:hypothetical protein
VLDLAHVPPLAPDELLARFILYSGWFNAATNTVKQDAFIPPADGELSVTRHLEAGPEEIWAVGERIARTRNRSLYGRADVAARAFGDQGLTVKESPIPENPNHAIATMWPAEKAAKKLIALEIAKRARLVRQ